MIHLATDRDLPALAALLDGFDTGHAAHFRADAGPGASPGQGARILVYRTEGVPRACLTWRPAEPDHSGKTARLDHIFVQPIWRRRGLGTRLILHFEQEIARVGCSGWIAGGHGLRGAAVGLFQDAGATWSGESYRKALQTPA